MKNNGCKTDNASGDMGKNKQVTKQKKKNKRVKASG